MRFGEALTAIQVATLSDKPNCNAKGMRLPNWQPDVVVRVHKPNITQLMTAPYLYVESRFGRVPWKETMIEMFSTEWILVE